MCVSHGESCIADHQRLALYVHVLPENACGSTEIFYLFSDLSAKLFVPVLLPLLVKLHLINPSFFFTTS